MHLINKIARKTKKAEKYRLFNCYTAGEIRELR